MVCCFEITEDLAMGFEGESCNILNADGVVEEWPSRWNCYKRGSRWIPMLCYAFMDEVSKGVS